MEEEKKAYAAPAVELVSLGADDVIVASGSNPGEGPNETPVIPIG